MKTAVIKTFILLIVLLTAAAFPYRAYAEESVIIDGYSADIPPELEKSLSDAGITPQSIDSEALSVDKVISNVTGMLWESIKSPLKLLISLISVTLLCSIANVFADNTSGNLKTVFSLVSVLACSTITVSAASDSLTAASFSDLFGISQLTGLMKCAEGVSSIITAMLVSFLLMAVISISLMIFMAGGAV